MAAVNCSQPNILFILSDQQRWDTVGAYESYAPPSPNLDRLAAEGVLFRHAFTCQPLCGPARACLQTGRYASRTGCVANNIALPTGQPTLARLLRQNGYDVGYVGKWHLASSGLEGDSYHYRPVPREKRGGYDGFWMAADLPEFISNGYEGVLYDENEEEVHWRGYRADAYTDFAIRYLDARPKDSPFFLFLSYVEPHPQPYHSRYRGPEPESREGIIRDYLRYDAPMDAARRQRDPTVPTDLVDSPGDWESGYADYLACCERVDSSVGRLFDYLEREGLLDDTLIIFTSDHGCHFHTRHQRNDKCSCHDNSLRVPLILRGPRFPATTRTDSLVSLIDLPPTVLRSAGASVPDEMMGYPLQDTLGDRRRARRDSVYFEISSPGTGRGVRTRDWKYAVYADESSPGACKETHLYNLTEDPFEMNNMVQDPALEETRLELRRELLYWMERTGQGCPSVG